MTKEELEKNITDVIEDKLYLINEEMVGSSKAIIKPLDVHTKVMYIMNLIDKYMEEE